MKRKIQKKATTSKPTEIEHAMLRVVLPVEQWSVLPVPGAPGLYRGCGYVPVLALKAKGLEKWLNVNPRRPERRADGKLMGPMAARIRESITQHPEGFASLSRGVTLSVHRCTHSHDELTLELLDPSLHGILDGGTTTLTLLEIMEQDLAVDLTGAYVLVSTLVGVPEGRIVDIADALNRSMQVDKTSLNSKRGNYDSLREAMTGHPGADQIKYYKGGTGSVYVNHLAAALVMLNRDRYSAELHPTQFAKSLTRAEDPYAEDLQTASAVALLPLVGEVMRLRDLICLRFPVIWSNEAPKRYGKYSETFAKDAKTYDKGTMALPFLLPADRKSNPDITIARTGIAQMQYRIPPGFYFPVLAAFRANLQDGQWIVPITASLVDAVLEGCVAQLIGQTTSKVGPQIIGSNNQVYRSCYDACARITHARLRARAA